MRLDPDFALAWATLARAHLEIDWTASDHSPARLAKAREAADRAAKLQPEARLALGDLRFRVERDWEGAMTEYRVALAIEPGNASAHEAAAYVLRRMDRWEEALRSGRLAAELAPDDPTKHAYLGGTLILMRRFGAAAQAYRRSLALAEAAGLEASVLHCQPEVSGDWARYEQAMRALLPRLTSAETRVTLLVTLRDFPRALGELRALPDPDFHGPTLDVAYPKELEIAHVLRCAGQAEEARQLCAAVAPALAERVRASPQDAPLRMKWAQALAGAGDAETARREAEAAVHLLPESRDAITGTNLLTEHAKLLGFVHQPEEACALLDHLLSRPGRLSPTRLRYSPEWDALRGYPRFERIVSAR